MVNPTLHCSTFSQSSVDRINSMDTSPHSPPLNPDITSVKIIKNEVGCRDDTVPKTVETRRHCEEE